MWQHATISPNQKDSMATAVRAAMLLTVATIQLAVAAGPEFNLKKFTDTYVREGKNPPPNSRCLASGGTLPDERGEKASAAHSAPGVCLPLLTSRRSLGPYQT